MKLPQLPDGTINVPTHIVDASALGVTLGAVIGYLPSATAILSFVWVCLRIWETKTVQDMVAKWKARK